MLKSLVTLWPYVRRYKGGLVLGIGALILKDLLAAAQPLVIKYGVDSLTRGFQLRVLVELAGGLIALSGIKGVFQYWMRVIIIGISRDIEFDLRNDLFGCLTRLSQDFYGRYRTGDIMARSTNDLNAVRMMLGPGIMYWGDTTLMLIAAISVMLATDAHLTFVSLAPAPSYPSPSCCSGAASTHGSNISRACFQTSAAAYRRTWRACEWCALMDRRRRKSRSSRS